MKTGYWIVIIMVAWLLSVAVGYKASSATGIQPGYFESAEAGGYGGGAATIEGISEEVQDYYKDLYKENE